MNHPDMEHVPVMLAGRFKREIGEKLFCQPLAVRSKSGLEYRKWAYRVMERYAAGQVVSGPIFRTPIHLRNLVA